MRSLVLAVIGLASGLLAQADVIRPARGKAIVGRVWEEGVTGVTFNVYRTGIRKVTHGTEQLTAKAVKSVTADPDPDRTFWRRAAALATGTAAEWFELGEAALANKRKGLARHAFVEALVREPDHAGAKRRLDSAGKKQLAADPRASETMQAKLAAYLTEPDAAARTALYGELTKLGCAWPQHYLDRARRSAAEGTGRTEDRLLTLRADEVPGVYTLLVPESYDPLVPTPLLVALHGGGPAGHDGKRVTGSGSLAMNFYRDAERLGWIVVCPNALAAPWREAANAKLIEAVIDEMTMLFNIDRNRICLTGHSMGGYGAWHYGPLMAHRFAAIAPMAGGGGGGLQRLRDTKTGVYLYHGADDAVVGVGQDRAIAERMRDDDMDFVYAEIPDSGHGFPDEVKAEMWEFFAIRRLAVTRGRRPKGKFAVAEDVLSSFLEKPGKEELRWFGSLEQDFGAGAPRDLDALIERLELGGGAACSAAERLAVLGGADVAARVVDVMRGRKTPASARRFAAAALGKIADPATAEELQRALGDADLTVIAAAARALGAVPRADTAAQYLKCVDEVIRRFEGGFIGGHADVHDFADHARCLQAVVEGATAHADPAFAEVVARVVTAFLLEGGALPFNKRPDDPALDGVALARAALAGCKAYPGDAVRPALEGLAGRSDLGVADEARALLAR